MNSRYKDKLVGIRSEQSRTHKRIRSNARVFEAPLVTTARQFTRRTSENGRRLVEI